MQWENSPNGFIMPRKTGRTARLSVNIFTINYKDLM